MTALSCVSVSTRNMVVSRAVVFAAFLLATLTCISTKPHSSIIRERHIIHAPINFRVIHHYKVQRVPLIIKKHLHYHKPYAQEARAAPEETQDSDEYASSGGVHLQDEGKVSGWRGEEGEGYPLGLGGFGIPWRSPGQEGEEEESEEEDYEEEEESEDGDYE